MWTDRQRLFVFRDAAAARLFVCKVAFALRDVAMLVDGEHVSVIDGGEEPRTEVIDRLARASGPYARS